MENLFSFEYVENQLSNQDGTKSNFRQVFGENGVNVACPKGTYHIVKTADVSKLGNAFVDKGYDVKSFLHRSGEVIGLSIGMGNKPSKVGDCAYTLLITIPNNNGGKGYLSVHQVRLICSNGMVSNKTMHKDNYIKIPHTIDYKNSLILMQKSIESFASLLEQVEERDSALNDKPMTDVEVRFQLNKWFFEQELPSTHKNWVDAKGEVQPMTFDDFRKFIATEPEQIKSIARYEELIDAYKREQDHNKTLNLSLSMYTVYATVTNYLSRRVEKSNSTASNEVQVERASAKLAFFDNI